MLEPFDGSCFHDLSSPKPNPFKLWGVAKRFARSITPVQWPALAESVAREAFRRVFQREPPGAASSGWDLRRILKRQEHSFLDCAHLRTHANEIDLTLDWNSSRRDLLVERGRWRTYDDDPDFAAWLDHLPPTHRRSYEYRWLPPDISRRGLVLLLSLPELVPMPEPLIRLYFKRQLWRPRTAAEGGMATVPAHLVALTCQRLLAYHCARHARFGQWHVIRLIRKLHGRDWRVDSPDVGASRFSMFIREPLFVGATLCEHWVQDWIPRIQRVLEDSTRCLSTPQNAKSELLRLLPNQLLVCDACRGCKAREGTPTIGLAAQAVVLAVVLGFFFWHGRAQPKPERQR